LDLGMLEINEAAQVVQQAADPEANIIFGAVIDEHLEGQIQITVIATGFEGPRRTAEAEASVSEPAAEVAAPLREAPRLGLDDLDIPAFLRKR
jgi:cell division protein FtsZ